MAVLLPGTDAKLVSTKMVVLLLMESGYTVPLLSILSIILYKLRHFLILSSVPEKVTFYLRNT